MSGHRRLDSYHHDEREVVVNHDLGTFDPGPPRRLVFRWLEHGQRQTLALQETADGTFRGQLEYVGSEGWGPDALVASVATKSADEWEITITGTPPEEDAAYVYTVYARVDEDQ